MKLPNMEILYPEEMNYHTGFTLYWRRTRAQHRDCGRHLPGGLSYWENLLEKYTKDL